VFDLGKEMAGWPLHVRRRAAGQMVAGGGECREMARLGLFIAQRKEENE